jgi:hypothetical protein
MDWVPRFDEFRNAVRFQELRRSLARAGLASVGFGAIAFATSVRDIGENASYVVLALVALGLVLEGLWILTTVNARGLVSDGILLLTVGLLNLVLMVAALRAGGVAARPLILGAAGTWQVLWGYRNFRRFRHYVLWPVARPAPGVHDDIDILARHVAAADCAAEPDMLAFRERGRPWQAWLAADKAVFVRGRAERAVFVAQAEVRFEEAPRRPDGNTAGTFVLGGARVAAVVPEASLRRFDDWKQGRLAAAPPPKHAAPAPEPVAGHA